MTELVDLELQEIAAGLTSGEFSAEELVLACLEGISSLDGTLNSFVTVMAESALTDARNADRRRADGNGLGPLDGIPLAIKDNIDIAGVPTTNGLALPDPPVAPSSDARVIARLRAGGAVFVGKTNMDEGALGGGTDNPHHGRTQNPWKIGHSAGGSSGGSGAAVAARLVPAALGSDTMGSVRIPAAYCGIVGLKPTFGLVSTRGVAPMSWRLDHLGVLCRTVGDSAIMLRAIAGYDPDCVDAVRPPEGFDPEPAPSWKPEGQRIGILLNFAEVSLEPDVEAAFSSALDLLKDLGCQICEIQVPDYRPTPARLAGLLVSEAESAVFHEAAMQRQPEVFSPYYASMLTFGSKVGGLKLMKAERAIRVAGHGLLQAFRNVDLVVSPTVPDTAHAFEAGGVPYQADMLAIANFAGCPAISIPCGLGRGGLPVGLQIIGKPWRDGELLAAAIEIEQALGFHLRPPVRAGQPSHQLAGRPGGPDNAS